MSHPANIKGWEGDLRGLAKAIENLRYDRLHLFLEALATALKNRAENDWKANKSRLAAYLELASEDVQSASARILRAWAVCKPFMPSDNKGE